METLQYLAHQGLTAHNEVDESSFTSLRFDKTESHGILTLMTYQVIWNILLPVRSKFYFIMCNEPVQ